MRRIVSFALSAMVVQLGVAGIAGAEESFNRQDDFKIECRFMGDGAKKEKDKSARQCYATAFIDDDHHGPRVTNENDRDKHHDSLAVACDGNVIYDNGARHSEIGGFDFISGHGGTPVIKFQRNHHDDVTSAWLNLNGIILEGFCAIEKESPRPRPTNLE